MSKLDELMELADAYALEGMSGADVLPRLPVMQRGRDALQDALKAVVECAERYQAWKDAYMSEEDDPTPVMIAITNAWTSEDLDAAIDAARKP